MCRYMSMGPYQYKYKCKWICVGCRKSVKANHENLQTCGTCGKVMHDIGLDYRPPRKTSDSGWRKLSKLIKDNVEFHSCGCVGPSLKKAK